VNYGEDFTIQPTLAEKWELNPDGKSYTFYLRKGVQFSNGKEMTSDDVIASAKRWMQVSARKGNFTTLKSVDAKDKYTVVFQLSEPTGNFLDAMAYQLGNLVIYPKEVMDAKDTGKLATEDLIGTGPYKIVEWKPDQIIRLVRNDLQKPLAGARSGFTGAKISYFDEIDLIPVPEVGARVAGLETGAYDWVDGIPASEYDRLAANKDIKINVIKPAMASMLLFNHADPISGNVKFRQAVLAALDMDAIGMAIANGRKDFYSVSPSIVAPASPYNYDDDPFAKQLYNAKNPDKAKQLLKEAGYNNEEIIMTTNKDYDIMYKTIVTAADQLKKAGMNVKVQVLDWPGQQALWKQKTGWHISTTYYASQYLYANDSLAGFYQSTSQSAERGFYSSPAMDKAWDDVAKALTLDARKAAFKKVQQVFYEELPNIKTADYVLLTGMRSNIMGHTPFTQDTRFWGDWRQ